MRRNSKKLLSLLMSAALSISVFTTAAASLPVSADSTVTSSKAVDPVAIHKNILDFRSEKALNTKGGIYHHVNADGSASLEGGKYSWDTEKQALKVEYHVRGGLSSYRIMFSANKDSKLTDIYKYMAIVYQAKTDQPFSVSIWNTPRQGQNAVLKSNGADTNGKWVVSDPVDISLTDEKSGKSILSRWTVDKNINTISFNSTDLDAEFYIKQVGFFKSAEDAMAYYSAVDLEKAPSEYDNPNQQVIIPGGVLNLVYTDVKEPETGDDSNIDESNLPAPVVIDFSNLISTFSNANLTDHNGNTEGKYRFFKTEDGTECLRLEYSPFGSFAHYRVMPSLSKKNMVTQEHKYVRITYMTSDLSVAQLQLKNNANNKDIAVIAANTSVSRGEWVRSNAAYIGSADSDILTRFVNGMHCTLEYTSLTTTSNIHIKELAFFASKKQAYDYYGDEPTIESSGYSVMTFGKSGTGSVNNADESYGKNEINIDTNTIDITYAASTNHGVNYMAKLQFKSAESITDTHRFVRVLYAADQPSDSSNVKLFVRNDKGGERNILVNNLKDTNGEFVLSDTVCISAEMAMRLAGTGDGYSKPMHASFCTNSAFPDAKYSIKAIYFFATRAEAEAFEIPDGSYSVNIAGNDISKYQIVIPKDSNAAIISAQALAEHIEFLTGAIIPIVTDDAPVSDYEIQIGLSSRPETQNLVSDIAFVDSSFNVYKTALVGNKLIISSPSYFPISAAVDILMTNYLFKGLTVIPDIITIDSKCSYTGASGELKIYGKWDEITNVDDPDNFTDDFSVDDGWWQEENNTSDWTFANGEYITSAGDARTLSYLHVYEANAVFSAKLNYTSAGKNGDMGLMLRYAAPDAHIKAGYDFANSEWYIEYRECNDLAPVRVASAKAAVTAGTVYTLSFTVDGGNASLSVNGKELITASGIKHVSPGRVAVFAQNASVAVDDADVLLLSGIGTIMRDVVHNRLPDELFREGGTVMEMGDGTLVYQTQHSSISFRSLDNGYTWEKCEAVFPIDAYPQALRLNNGDWINVRYGTYTDGTTCRYATISHDDGKTWEIAGKICPNKYGTGGNVNMNDKIMQSPTTGRIWYSQNYDAQGSGEKYLGKYLVYGVFYYSDDNGKTWHESEMGTWEIDGNGEMAYFGESKVLECADGTVRLYNSWNNYGCIAYAESTDSGNTWGPLVLMPEFVCARSSMQFVRDPYGETDTTYYMVWVNSAPEDKAMTSPMTRNRLSLAKTTDGKNWEYLGDLWHWQINYKKSGAMLAHVVDPFIQCTKNTILVGTGYSEYMPFGNDESSSYHGAQRQHIWTIARESVSEAAKPMNRFTDVALGAPYYSAISYVSSQNLFNGVSTNEFAPDTIMSRSMFVTVLGRLDGVNADDYTKVSFNDVIPGSWYAPYVEWAASKSIVNGIGNGLYGIDNAITVEQACLILMRYCDSKSASTQTGLTAKDFADSIHVSSWASDGIAWALANGIYDGQNGLLCPTAPASRAVVAEMFYNFTNIIGE